MFDIIIPYVLATVLILVVPGPTIILVVSQAATHGPRSVTPLVLGVLLGDATAMTLSMLGLGALLSASATVFGICKWVGAIYLFYLGIRLWRAPVEEMDAAVSAESPSGPGLRSGPALLRDAWLVTALNPKSIAFFVAFLPQFVDRHAPAAPQLFLLGAIFLTLATVNAALYAMLAGRLREHIRRPRLLRWFHRLGGGALMGAGVLTAGVRRAA
jgi:threonine/homoserine/homoserine lactone efflux protein